MKNIDLTTPVMKKVVRYESNRIRVWFLRFGLVISFLTAVLIIALVIAGTKIRERQTLDLLTLFQEDREIIAQFWQDTLATFFDELPQRALLSAGIALIVIASIVVMTRRKRTIIRRKLRELAKY